MGYTGNDFEQEFSRYIGREFERLMDGNVEAFLQKMLVGMVVLMLAVMAIALACWIIRSIALTRLGRVRGVQSPWLVWLPVVGYWTIGAIADEYDGRNGIKRRWRVLLLVCSILVTATYSGSYGSFFSTSLELALSENLENAEFFRTFLRMMIGVYAAFLIAVLAMSILNICNYICLYKVFESTLPRHAVLCFILSILIPLAEPICLLIAANKAKAQASAVPALNEAPPAASGWYEA